MSESRRLLEVDGLSKHYSNSGLLDRILGHGSQIRAVSEVDLHIDRGEVLGIVGESGSGKSTLGETILRLEEPTAGNIMLDGENICEYDSRELRKLRQQCQIIFQDPYETINPRHTVYQAVSEPLKNFSDLSQDELREQVATMLAEVGLRPPENYLDSYPKQLSGGQRQRVNIARALILEPNLLIADEPVSMLDVSIQASILKTLEQMKEKLGFSILFISHNISVVDIIADRIGVMYRGELVEMGTNEQIIHDPKHPYTRALINSLPDLSSQRERVLLPSKDDDGTQLTGCKFHPRCPDRMEECTQRSPKLTEAEDRSVSCFLYHDVTK